MIQANELMVGNKAYFNGNVITIQQILSDSVIAYMIADMPDDEYSFSEINPIPLSPEILEKCGFEKYQWQDAYFIKTVFGDLYIHFYQNIIITRMVKVSEDNKGHKMVALPFVGNVKSVENIIHLHHLQNWYYFNTLEELPYTP